MLSSELVDQHHLMSGKGVSDISHLHPHSPTIHAIPHPHPHAESLASRKLCLYGLIPRQTWLALNTAIKSAGRRVPWGTRLGRRLIAVRDLQAFLNASICICILTVFAL